MAGTTESRKKRNNRKERVIIGLVTWRAAIDIKTDITFILFFFSPVSPFPYYSNLTASLFLFASRSLTHPPIYSLAQSINQSFSLSIYLSPNSLLLFISFFFPPHCFLLPRFNVTPSTWKSYYPLIKYNFFYIICIYIFVIYICRGVNN